MCINAVLGRQRKGRDCLWQSPWEEGGGGNSGSLYLYILSWLLLLHDPWKGKHLGEKNYSVLAETEKKTFYLSVTCRENKRKRWKHLFLSLKSVSKVWPQAQLWALDCLCRSILPLVRVFWSPLVLIYQRATTQCFYTCQCFVK